MKMVERYRFRMVVSIKCLVAFCVLCLSPNAGMFMYSSVSEFIIVQNEKSFHKTTKAPGYWIHFIRNATNVHMLFFHTYTTLHTLVRLNGCNAKKIVTNICCSSLKAHTFEITDSQRFDFDYVRSKY